MGKLSKETTLVDYPETQLQRDSLLVQEIIDSFRKYMYIPGFFPEGNDLELSEDLQMQISRASAFPVNGLDISLLGEWQTQVSGGVELSDEQRQFLIDVRSYIGQAIESTLAQSRHTLDVYEQEASTFLPSPKKVLR